MWQTIATTTAIIGAMAAIQHHNRKAIIMAIGTESAAAINEVKAAITAEASQAADKIIELVGADRETAAGIRELLAPIAGIIPDGVDVPAEGQLELGGEETPGVVPVTDGETVPEVVSETVVEGTLDGDSVTDPARVPDDVA